MKRTTLRRGALTAGLAFVLAGAAASSAVATPVKWLPIRLGTHRFGHLSKPEAIVAKAGPKEVGFWIPENGEGSPLGPWSFDVGRDGSVWLMDQFNNRLLAWSPERPRHPRTIQLPLPAAVDFALGKDGLIYVISRPSGEPSYLYAMSSAGEVRWKAPTIPIDTFNAQLRMTSDGALYYNTLGELGWVPLVTPDGRPVPLAEQRRRASALQPMPGGLRLATADVSEHQKEFSLLDRSGHIVRAWRVTSKTTLWLTLTTASMLGRDLVVALDVTRETDSKYLFEHLILRLGSAGGIRAFLALDPHAISDVDAPITEVRLGPDGRFYQLRESPETGVSIARYSLEPRPVAAPQPGPSTAGAPPAPAPTATQPTPIPTTVQATPMSRGSEDTMAEAPARAGDGRSSRSLSVLQMLVPMGACGVVVAWLYGSRRRRGRSTPPSST